MIKEVQLGDPCTCGRTTQVLVNGVGQIGIVCWGHSDQPRRPVPVAPALPTALVCPAWCTRPTNHPGGCVASPAAIAAIDPANGVPSSWARAQATTQPKPKAPVKPPRTCGCGVVLVSHQKKCPACKPPARAQATTQPKPKAPRLCPCGTALVGRQKKCPTCPRARVERKGHRTYQRRQCSKCPVMYQPTGPRGTTCSSCQ